MSKFLGMALYTKDEIGSSLEKYKKALSIIRETINDKVTQAELGWEPTRWQKLFGVNTLKDYWRKSKSCIFQGYKDFLYKEKIIILSVSELMLIKSIEGDYFNMRLNRRWDDYTQVEALFDGGRDCYLNPTQAAFVNRFKGVY